MKQLRFLVLSIVLGTLLLLTLPGAFVAAADNTTPTTPPPPPPKIELAPTYPTLTAIAGGNFGFEVALKYTGDNPLVFDLRASAPPGWDVYITPQYQTEKKIQSIRLEAGQYGAPSTTTILVNATAPVWPLPDPGTYNITLESTAGAVKGSTTLGAVITAKYILNMVPANANQVYNTTATAGRDNTFSIKIQNIGTAPITNITLSSTKPDGWAVEYKPDKVDSLQAFSDQSLDVNIKPPAKAIAGDYVISLTANGKEASATKMDVRVTVETPSVWGWVGVGIIVVVVAGLVVTFMRFSRR